VQPTDPGQRWTIVVPLKSTTRGKSRIDVEPGLRSRLAMAMALDTLAAAALAELVETVLVVTESPADASELAGLAGVRVLLTEVSGLNESIRHGIASLPESAQLIAALPADLPSLTAGELNAALANAAVRRQAAVADRQGTGTTLLTASSPAALRPQYGAGSLGRHVAAGAVILELPVESGLRRDVDRAVDLAGVTGPRTTALLEGTGRLPLPAGRLCAGPAS
jgi:2-phospho-L-lactate guanylyltransferase